MEEQILQKYSQQLAQANHDKIVATVNVEKLQNELNAKENELSEFLRVLNSDESLKAIFYEQKDKLNKGE